MYIVRACKNYDIFQATPFRYRQRLKYVPINKWCTLLLRHLTIKYGLGVT